MSDHDAVDRDTDISVAALLDAISESPPDDRDLPVPEAPMHLDDAVLSHQAVGAIYAAAGIVLSNRDPGPTGADIRQSADRTLGRELSPGTIYPYLNDLRERGLIEKVPLPTAVPYRVADPEEFDALLADYEGQLRWALALVIAARHELGTDTDPDD